MVFSELSAVGGDRRDPPLLNQPKKGIKRMRRFAIAATLGGGSPSRSRIGAPTVPQAAARVTARRLPENPLITTRSSASLGDNINGPTVIRVPSWVKQPLGRYYMYFAHHMGAFVRLAYADRIEGPWKIYEPGVLPVRDTAFFRPQPDPPENLENFYTHVASPEIYVDTERQRLILWFHGWYTDGQRWPIGEPAAREWARQHGYGQFTQVAESSDGIHFDVRPAISRTSYLRVFPHGEHFTGWLGWACCCARQIRWRASKRAPIRFAAVHMQAACGTSP